MFEGQDKVVLLVEDHAIIAMSKKVLLEKQGLRVQVAYDGETAIELATRDREIDLILMDIDLGRGIDGTIAAQRILEVRNVPIVFLTSHSEPEIVKKVKGITRFGYVLKTSGEFVLFEAIQTAFELFEAQSRLKQANENWRNTFDAVGEIVMVVSADHTILQVNKAGCDAIGVDADEIVGKKCFHLVHGLDYPIPVCPCTDSLKTGLPGRAEHSENGRTYELIAWPVRNAETGVVDSFLHVVTDISDRNTTEEEIFRGERERHATIAEMSPIGISTVDEDGIITYANPAAENILGLSRDKITSRTYDAPEWEHTAPDGGPFPDEHQPFSIVKRTLKPVFDVRHGITWPDGRHVELSINASPILEEDGGFGGMIATIEDITDRKKAEDRVHALLREKALLLRESHHRVTNNMSTIHSLLSLQSSATDSLEAQEKLNDAARRVQTMARVYDTLFRNERTGPMNIREFLVPLINEAVAVFSAIVPIRVTTEVDDVSLDSKLLTSLGIIVNELVTNSVKHAFADTDEGRISMTVRSTDGRVVFTYRDDGPGLGEDATTGTTHGFGMELIGATIEGLGGRVQIQPGPGFRIEIEIPNS